MKFSKQEIMQATNGLTFDDTITFDKKDFVKMHGLRDLKNINVSGSLSYDERNDLAHLKFEVDGIMVVPCAITNDDVDYEFSCEGDYLYAFHKVDRDEDIIEVKKDIIEILPQIFQTIVLEVPLKVVKPGLKEYPKGDGWEVVSEEDMKKQKEQRVDPRLAKLAEFKFEDD